MAFQNFNDYFKSLPNAQVFWFSFNLIQVSGVTSYGVFWPMLGLPNPGELAATATICTRTTMGSFPYQNATGGNSIYCAILNLRAAASRWSYILVDRLAHITNLSTTSTSVQTVGIDVSVGGLSSRIGLSDYSEVQWFIESYGDTGVGTFTTTVTYTNAAGVSGQTISVTIATLGFNLGRAMLLVGNNGEKIKSIESVQNTAVPPTTTNFGIAAVRPYTSAYISNYTGFSTNSFSKTTCPKIPTDACLTGMVFQPLGSSTVSAVHGQIVLCEG